MYQQPRIDPSHPLQKLPAPVKRQLARAYWITRDLTDYAAEIAGKLPSHILRLALYRHLFGMHIGPHTSIHRGCRLYHPSHICIGHNTVINREVLLDGRMGIVIGDNVSISEGVCLFSLEHDLQSLTFENQGAPIEIKDYVFVGARAIILPGVCVKDGAAIGAGTVVTRDVEPYAIVAGVPARRIGSRSHGLIYELDHSKLMGSRNLKHVDQGYTGTGS